jgi:hypothetical protein
MVQGTQRSGVRQLLAVVLLAELCLVITAPLWHHEHLHSSYSRFSTADHPGSDLHVCDTGAHLSGPLGTCPICLSQRQLTQGQTEQPADLSAPSNRANIVTLRPAAVSFGLSHTCQPRAPPAA